MGMTFSTSIKSYADCFDLFDRALASPLGIRNRCEGPGDANQLRGRLHYARNLQRKESRSIYDSDAPEYDTSAYDPLLVRIRESDGAWWVYIEHRRVAGEVQELAAE